MPPQMYLELCAQDRELNPLLSSEHRHRNLLDNLQCMHTILRRGRRGRVTLILLPPVEARALVVLRWLLRGVVSS